MKPHVTSFQWIPPSLFQAALRHLFEVEDHVDGGTTVYVCRRR